MERQSLRYFIYVRKSSESEEKQARSIHDQLAEIRTLVQKDGIDIVGSYEESQSAKTKGRPFFNEMLNRIEAGDADGIVAWHPDRLARNALDGGRVIDLLDEGKLKDLRFCTFWFEPTAQGKLMLNLAFGQSKYYSDNLSTQIKRAQRQKTNEGVWSWQAPLGYLNDPKHRTIVIDPVKGPLVRMAFESYATGHYTISSLRDTFNAKGLRSVNGLSPSLSCYQYFLVNPFYYGVFVLHGEMHQGVHEQLVSKNLYDKVQEVMRRRSKPSPVRLKSYAYRGLFRCGECGCVVTMETQKGHNYLRCTKRLKTKCSQRYLWEEAINKQIGRALLATSLPDNTADQMVDRIKAERGESQTILTEAKTAAAKALKSIDLKLDRLTAAYLDAGAFTAPEFRKRKEILLGDRQKIRDDLTALDHTDYLRFEPLIRFINGSKQRKYDIPAAKAADLRVQLEEVGSNLKIKDRKLQWEPRGAWKLVVDHGSFAQSNAAPTHVGAALIGKIHQTPMECTR